MNPLKVIEQRCPDRPLWDPLLKVLPEKTVAQFMFMGEVLCESGTRIFLYKHVWSRRYLNLDQQGQAYQFRASERGSHYVPIELSGATRRASSFYAIAYRELASMINCRETRTRFLPVNRRAMLR